jgi:chromosome partitioning protein
MKTLVLANQKGGVGKSAVATLLCHHLSQQRQRVLAIDFDHQGNFSGSIGRSNRATPAGITADRLLTEAISVMPCADFVIVTGGAPLSMLELQSTLHTPFARNLRAFFKAMDQQFDVCVIDTNPAPDIRVIAALASADFVLSPVQLNQEAMEGVHGLLNHQRAGARKIKAVLNPKLHLIGLLPTMVEATPFQKSNFVQIVNRYYPLLIRMGDNPADIASIPRRSAIAEAQASGEVLWEMKKTAARDAWKEIESTIRHLAKIVTGHVQTAQQPTGSATFEVAPRIGTPSPSATRVQP